MHSCKCLRIFPVAILLGILIFGIIPVNAENNSTVTIAYWGAGGYYIGDNIIFNGKNTVGNQTMIRISGPGLATDGVPAYNLTGTPGTGTYVSLDQSGSYIFAWDTSRAIGNDYLQTARYTITAYDQSNPDLYTTTSVMLKKPEFYASMTPNPATLNEYVHIVGDAEKGADTIQIDILNTSGSKIHTYMTPVSESGYFQYGFHVDMTPGEYTVKITNPSLAHSITKTLIIADSRADIVNGTVVTHTTMVTPESTLEAATSGSLMVSSTPPGGFVYLDSVMVGNTPLTLDSVPAGSHTVEIRSDSYAPYTETVVITSGQQISIAPQLKKSSNGAPLSPLTAIAGCIGAVALLILFTHKKE